MPVRLAAPVLTALLTLAWASSQPARAADGTTITPAAETFELGGHRYVGAMRDGNFHGPGMAELSDGTRLDGRWRKNRFQEGLVRRADGLEYRFNGRLTYIFRRLPRQVIVGAGKATLTDGRHYVGMFDKFGRFHGEGRMLHPDGSVEQGFWRSGRFERAKPDHWRRTTLAAEGLAPDSFKDLAQKMEDGVYRKINSVIITIGGKLLLEAYFNRSNRYTRHNVESVGKSFTGALVGIAVDRGLIANIEAPLLTHLPAVAREEPWDPRKDRIVLEDLLTMSYGLASDRADRRFASLPRYGPDWIADVIATPAKSEPGSRFAYSSAASRLWAPIIARAAGMPVEEFARRYLFGPLGIDSFHFNALPDGHPSLAGLDGIMARDLAKFGQMYLDQGRWNGRQVLSKAWVQASTTSRIGIPGRADWFYGFYFWIRENWQVGSHRLRSVFASGLGGNKIFLFPDLDLVIVITSDAYRENYAHSQVDRLLEVDLLPPFLNRLSTRIE